MFRWLRWMFRAERLVALALLAVLAALRGLDPAPIEILRLKSFDLMQQAKPRPTPSDMPVMIVDIDEDSLRRYGQWPWPRALLAQVVDRLAAAKAKAVGFDVLFPEPDRLSGPALAQALKDADPEIRAKLQEMPSGEAILARAMMSVPVVVGVSGYDKPVPAAAPPRTGAIVARGEPPDRFLFSYPGLVRARPELESAASGLGLVTVMPERDGTVRRVPTLLVTQGATLPTLDVELLRIASGGQSLVVRSDAAGIASVAVAGQLLPTDRNGQIWLNFGRHDNARFVSAADLLEGKVPADRIAGKIVLIGSSAVALFDLRTTPLDPLIPGVEIHAQVMENVVSNTLLVRPNYAVAVELAALLVMGAAVLVLVPLLGALPALAAGTALCVSLIAGGWMLFAQHRLLFDLSFPLLATLLIFATVTFFNYWREEAKRTQIRSAFGQYVSPALVETLVSQPERLKLGGETREMSILFSDVRGFTAISESFKGDPQGLVSLMNGMLTPLTNAILDARGTIDKYMGDAILAFWNAPLDDADHAGNACLAALDMEQRLKTLNARRKDEALQAGKPFLPINIGIGINTGQCVVGNFGSDVRFDYSVLGDSVNMASRLEALTATYGVSILVGAATAARATAHVAALPIDRVRVKGKKDPETIHAILGPKATETAPWYAPLAAANAAMFEAYTAADWELSRSRLAACRAADVEMRLSRLFDMFELRLDDLAQRSDPTQAWDGVYTFKSKDG